MKRTAIVISILIILNFISCSNKSDIKTNQNDKGKKILLNVKAGENWSYEKTIPNVNFKLKIKPQCAFWIVDEDGNYITTLFVTKCFGKQQWGFAEYDPNTPFRTSSLPYWLNQYKKTGKNPPTKNNPLSDAVTGATPKKSFKIISIIPEKVKRFFVFAEFNSSFDHNTDYPENVETSSINGQPSVIFKTFIDMENLQKEYKMEISGRSGETGDDGSLYPDISVLTTAMNIVEEITIKFPTKGK